MNRVLLKTTVDPVARPVAADAYALAGSQVENAFKAALLQINPGLDLSSVEVRYEVQTSTVYADGMTDDEFNQAMAIVQQKQR